MRERQILNQSQKSQNRHSKITHSAGIPNSLSSMLRGANALTVSLVAENDGTLVGHIGFSPVTFTDGSENWYGLGPISVRGAYQKQGIGSSLVNEGLHLIKEADAEGCVVVGDPNYYERFGFKNPDGLEHEGVGQENFLALPFGGQIPQGIVEFHPAFGAAE